MGIKSLYRVINENTTNCICEKTIKDYKGKVIAVDVSLLLYQFVIAIRNNGYDMTDGFGNSTSHLYAIFIKTIKFIENGIKPIYVFDGTPPELKYNTINIRKKSRQLAQQKLDNMNIDDIDRIKLFKKTVIITKEQMNECKELITLMGIPYIDSPGEADAQCAYLVKNGLAYAVCSEDMDILTFGANKILRHMSSSKHKLIYEINLDDTLKSLDITREQFVDLCILLGCDYCDTIKGIGRIKALHLIKSMGSLEEIIKSEKWKLPDNFPYMDAKKYFLEPLVIESEQLNIVWKYPNNNKIFDFMCNQYGFDKFNTKKKLNNYGHYFNIHKINK